MILIVVPHGKYSTGDSKDMTEEVRLNKFVVLNKQQIKDIAEMTKQFIEDCKLR